MPFTFAAMTIAWLVGSFVLAYATFVIAFSNYGSPGTTPDWIPKGMGVVGLTVFVFGPLVVAGVAYAVRWRRTAVGYAILSGLVLVCTVLQLTWSPL